MVKAGGCCEITCAWALEPWEGPLGLAGLSPLDPNLKTTYRQGGLWLWSSFPSQKLYYSGLFPKTASSLPLHNWRYQIPEGNKQQLDLGQSGRRGFVVPALWMTLTKSQPCEQEGSLPSSCLPMTSRDPGPGRWGPRELSREEAQGALLPPGQCPSYHLTVSPPFWKPGLFLLQTPEGGGPV